ncbi:peptidoglycan recognition protein 5 [Cynoglossus semilaevis]|uniref:Peptidoglycan recognition protein 5 n=1 Tax=Cynoglossus semilaevis TaxID=244447 RepID=A0A3P8ULX1_CYNSE|nr:peptidoglycan-recognition protein SC2-like [Cynoglossus semilaevis]
MESQVTIITRTQWGAAEPKGREKLKSPAGRAIVHHTALPGCSSLDQSKKLVQSIQRGHMNDRGFDDIGYNFLVAADGVVFEGRGWGVVGAHTKGSNQDSLGIAFMGNFNNESPNKAALMSVKQLLQSGVSQGFLCPGFTVLGHRDLGSTQCPGDKLYAALPQLS